MRSPTGVGITGCGYYVPQNRVLNETIAASCGVSAAWIEERTGIKSRHHANAEETVSFMGSKAAQKALARTKTKSEDIGLILCCTSTGEYLFPPAACKIQQLLKAGNAGALDLSSGAAGFAAALTIAADRLTADPSLRKILVVAATAQSEYLNKSDAKTAVIFGDGAAAAVLSPVPKNYGLLGSIFYSAGDAFDAIKLGRKGSIEMDGLAVGKQYMKSQPVIIQRVLKKTGLGVQDIDLFIFHQANLRILEALMAKLKLPMKKTYTNVEKYGNTSDASVAIALSEAAEKGLLKRGMRILLSGVGPGMTFTASVLRWY